MTDEALDRIVSKDAGAFIINKNIGPTCLTIHGDGGRELLRISRDGTVSGEIENAGEAARVFVETVRRMIKVEPLL